jgi:hypothetical protein
VEVAEAGTSMKYRLSYLACPYTHKDHAVMVDRFQKANKASARYMANGEYIYSPISHTHPIAEAAEGTLPRHWDFWEGYDRTMISCCDRLLVLTIDGWKESKGVQAEIKIAEEMGLPIEYIEA